MAQLMSEEKMNTLPPKVQLGTLSGMFFEILGRGIFSLTEENLAAYVPLTHLRSSQSQTIAMVKRYDPQTQFCIQTRLHPDDAKFGAVVVYQKDSDVGLKSLELGGVEP